MMTEKRSGSSLYGLPPSRCFTDQESERDTFGVYGHYESLSAGKSIPVMKGMDKFEGLSCLPGEHWSYSSAKTDLPWQFGPGSPLDLDSQYITVEESPSSDLQDVAVVKDSKKSSEIELEWQLIMDQQQASKCEWFPLTMLKDSNTKDSGDASDKDAKEEEVTAETESCTTSSLFSGSKTEGSSDAETSKSSKVSGNLSVELNAAKSSHKDGAVWRTADSKELAALVSQKGHGYLENCDLPPSQNSLTWKGPLANCYITHSKNMKSGASSSADKVLLSSLIRGQESTHLEGRSLPLLGSSGSTQFCEHSPSVSQPQPIPAALARPSTLKSSDDQTMSWKARSGRHVGVTKHGFEALGEALCHSQTRARQAEKLAAQALHEREKLAQLLFKESWTARTYKQWVQTLELENMWLKMCSGNDMEVWMGKDFSGPSNVSEQIAINPWKHVRKRVSRKKTHHHFPAPWQGRHHKHGYDPEDNVWLRCTIGLAFALGLSFAGAGLMIGWSMGWILLAC
eukprot:c4964_g1_i2 orf=204-1739(+)